MTNTKKNANVIEVVVRYARPVGDDIEMTLDRNIKRYVKTNPDAPTEEEQYTLEEVNTLSMFYGEVVKGIMLDTTHRYFRALFSKVNFLLPKARKAGDAAKIDALKSKKDEAVSYAMLDIKLRLKFMVLPKGTVEKEEDVDGQKKQKLSQRPKMKFEIAASEMTDEANGLIKDMIRDF